MSGKPTKMDCRMARESCAMWWNPIWRKRPKTPFTKARATCAIRGISNTDCDMGKATYTSWD